MKAKKDNSAALLDRVGKITIRQYAKAVQTPNEYIKFYMSESNPTEWYLLIHGLTGDNDELKSGEYLFKMTAPIGTDVKDSFPFSPPKFTALTQNGIYGVNQNICISVGEFHKSDYPATLGMNGFAQEMANGLMCWKQLQSGIGIIITELSDDAKSKHKYIIDKIEKTITRIGELSRIMESNSLSEKLTQEKDSLLK
jgi:ubiquitin-protein ligase